MPSSGIEPKFLHQSLDLTTVVYKKAFDTSRARRTRLRRIYPNQNHNKHHTPGIIV